MNFSVNELLTESETNKIYRLLWIDESNIIAYLIDVDDKKALPFKCKISELKDKLINDGLIKTKQDLFLSATYQEVKESNLGIRDKAWSMIKDVVNKEPAVFDNEKRGAMVAEIIDEYKSTKPTIYKYLRRYWQRGKTPNALLPDYRKSGGRGKLKSVGEKKRGRPSKYGPAGINIDEPTKKIFRIAIEKYYLTNKKNSLPAAYKMMIKEFYAEDYYYEDGVKKIIVADESQLPTMDQFRYWYNKEYNVQESTIARLGRKKYEKDFRAVLGSSTFEAIGPGSRYQIDATVADVYLLSSYNPDWIIGRPVVYLVVDVFSRMIVGMYIGLEGPSWAGAMMALANVVADKHVFCQEYGIEISKSLWPCEHLPDVILADRGEFEGFNVERLISAFNIHVENAASYRADWKGIVEQQFNVIQRRVKPFLPGYVDKDFQERGVRDYRLDAKLTLEQFTQLIVKQVIYYNTKHYLKDYLRNEEMVRDEVQPNPLELWNWGIQNRSGKLRYFPEETVKLHLLPNAKATVTYKGIKLKNMYYSCERAIKESWFPTARQKGSWKVTVSYDPRNMSSIYLLDDSGYQFETCQLLDHQKRYANRAFDEVVYLLEHEKQMLKQAEHDQLQKDVDFMSDVDVIVKATVKEVNKQQSKNLSKAAKTKSIKEHRRNERKERQNEESVILGEKQQSKELAKVVSIDRKTDDELRYERPSIKEFLRRKKEVNKDE
jgi:hypothetical protein